MIKYSLMQKKGTVGPKRRYPFYWVPFLFQLWLEISLMAKLPFVHVFQNKQPKNSAENCKGHKVSNGWKKTEIKAFFFQPVELSQS